MKRMVKNSEKIEKLLENVNVGEKILFDKTVNMKYGFYSYDNSHFDNDVYINGKLITTNLTTGNNDQIYLFKSTDYSINNMFPGTVEVINLGTALLVKATINSETPPDLYTIMTIYKDSFAEFNYFKISNGNEFNIGTEQDVREFVMTTNFNETLADHTRPEYSLIFLIGHNGIQQ